MDYRLRVMGWRRMGVIQRRSTRMLARLTGGTVIIKVGGLIEPGIKERRVEGGRCLEYFQVSG